MARKMTDLEREMFWRFMAENPRCWTCGWEGTREGEWRDWMVNRLVNHHIIGGPSRIHDVRNLARVCDGCHRLIHGERIVVKRAVLPKLSLAHVLWVKAKRDPENYDRAFLKKIRGQALPDILELPKWHADQLRQRQAPWRNY